MKNILFKLCKNCILLINQSLYCFNSYVSQTPMQRLLEKKTTISLTNQSPAKLIVDKLIHTESKAFMNSIS